jgi:hypothetical protein
MTTTLDLVKGQIQRMQARGDTPSTNPVLKHLLVQQSALESNHPGTSAESMYLAGSRNSSEGKVEVPAKSLPSDGICVKDASAGLPSSERWISIAEGDDGIAGDGWGAPVATYKHLLSLHNNCDSFAFELPLDELSDHLQGCGVSVRFDEVAFDSTHGMLEQLLAPHARIEYESWDADAPGCSGVYVRVFIDEAALPRICSILDKSEAFIVRWMDESGLCAAMRHYEEAEHVKSMNAIREAALFRIEQEQLIGKAEEVADAEGLLAKFGKDIPAGYLAHATLFSPPRSLDTAVSLLGVWGGIEQPLPKTPPSTDGAAHRSSWLSADLIFLEWLMRGRQSNLLDLAKGLPGNVRDKLVAKLKHYANQGAIDLANLEKQKAGSQAHYITMKIRKSEAEFAVGLVREVYLDP